MIEPIFSSKLFAVSNRKDAIRAAASNPINQNLMQQLSTALDKPYQKAEYLLDEDDQAKLKQKQSADTEPEVKDDIEVNQTESNFTEPKGTSTAPHRPSNLHSKFKEAEKNMSEDEQAPTLEDAPMDDSGVDTTTEAATDIDNGIVANNVDEEIQDTKSLTDSVKTTLNNNAETKGVSRVSIKDDELWVYYEDSINLNKVMANVIETLNSLDYGLEFNRLARTDNAIVFDIKE
jgi:hypothetical protein